ncbi:hypothetical protein HaLaN_19336 [Haematococcus lacustris]|uniref:Uncharacterized protein n=1 Tax=Haematococcus lacustris TaxID=44745 RepID=A0A699ZTE3_HAELA|nr:hypothetical protein HaLaN_19336 [Haematococcus lacustris]
MPTVLYNSTACTAQLGSPCEGLAPTFSPACFMYATVNLPEALKYEMYLRLPPSSSVISSDCGVTPRSQALAPLAPLPPPSAPADFLQLGVAHPQRPNLNSQARHSGVQGCLAQPLTQLQQARQHIR